MRAQFLLCRLWMATKQQAQRLVDFLLAYSVPLKMLYFWIGCFLQTNSDYYLKNDKLKDHHPELKRKYNIKTQLFFIKTFRLKTFLSYVNLRQSSNFISTLFALPALFTVYEKSFAIAMHAKN